MRSSGVQLVCFLSVGLLPCILGRARPRSGLREAMRRRTGEEVDEITPIKSIEEVISMLPVKSIQEVKSVQGIDDDVAKAAIKRFGLKNKLAARSAGGYFDDYTSDYSSPDAKIAELAYKLMKCKRRNKEPLTTAESEEEEVGGKLYGESIEEVTPIKNIEEVKSLDEIKNIDEVKKIQELKSVEEVKSMLPVKSVEEVKSITPVKSVQEVKNLYELTDAQARELTREIRSYNRLILEE